MCRAGMRAAQGETCWEGGGGGGLCRALQPPAAPEPLSPFEALLWLPPGLGFHVGSMGTHSPSGFIFSAFSTWVPSYFFLFFGSMSPGCCCGAQGRAFCSSLPGRAGQHDEDPERGCARVQEQGVTIGLQGGGKGRWENKPNHLMNEE